MSADSRMPRRYGAAAATRLLGAATTSLRSSMLERSSAINPTTPATSQRSATTTLRGTRSGPSFCLFAYLWSTFFPCVGLKELTQISALGSRLRRRVHREFTQRSPTLRGLGPGFRSQRCRHSGKNATSAAKLRQRVKLSRVPRFGEMQHDVGHAAFRVSRPISRMTNRR